MRTLTDKEKRKEIKQILPCITASGLFSERKVSGLLQHSGLICIDIDGDDNPQVDNFEDLRDKVSRIVNVAYCSLSASGKGVFCLIPIKYPDKHKQHFEALKPGFEELGVVIDKNCSDVSRLRDYSYDPKAYSNMNAKTFTHLYESKPNITPTTNIFKKKPKLNFMTAGDSMEKVVNIVANIEKNAIDITGTYQQWFQIGCAFANEFGEGGRTLFHSVSQFNAKYQSTVTDTQFTNCLKGNYGISIGTFFHWAAEAGMI